MLVSYAARVDPDERKELLERLKLAHADYLAALAADWDRQKLLIIMNGAATVALGLMGARSLGAVIACALAALWALASILLVRHSRRDLRSATEALLRVEYALREPVVVPEGTALDSALFAQGGGFVELQEQPQRLYEPWPVLEVIFLLAAVVDVVLAFR